MAQPVATDPTRVIGRRVLATLVDAALIFIPLGLIISANFEYIAEEQLGQGAAQFCDDYMSEGSGRVCVDLTYLDGNVYFADGPGSWANPTFLGLNFLLLVVLQGFTGWTPGKLLTGIRTVGGDGRPPGFVKALVRWLLWVVDGFPYLLPLVGAITALTTVGHRRVGDMAAKTFVVRAAAAGSPIVVPGLTAPAPPAGYAAGVPWATTGPPAPPPPATGPQWDEARGTYIQWDPGQGAWLQWDEPTHAWIRIPGQP